MLFPALSINEQNRLLQVYLGFAERTLFSERRCKYKTNFHFCKKYL